MSEFYFPAFDEFDLDNEERALCEYFLRLQCVFDRAQDEFHYVFATWQKLKLIRQAIQEEYDAMCCEGQAHMHVEPSDVPGVAGTISVPLIHMPGLSAGELREQSALLRAESAAGSLILMVDEIVQRLRHSIWDEATKSPKPTEFKLGELPSGVGYASTAVYAAGNAYRHAKDWDGLVDTSGAVDGKHRNYRESRHTLEILERLIGLEAVATRSACIATLARLSITNGHPSIGLLWDGHVTNVGRDFAKLYCEREDAFDRVEEALKYHASYSSFELSHSGNSWLFEDADAEEVSATDE